MRKIWLKSNRSSFRAEAKFCTENAKIFIKKKNKIIWIFSKKCLWRSVLKTRSKRSAAMKINKGVTAPYFFLKKAQNNVLLLITFHASTEPLHLSCRGCTFAETFCNESPVESLVGFKLLLTACAFASAETRHEHIIHKSVSATAFFSDAEGSLLLPPDRVTS